MEYAQARNPMRESGGDQIATDAGDLRDDNEEDFNEPPLPPHFSETELLEFLQDESVRMNQSELARKSD